MRSRFHALPRLAAALALLAAAAVQAQPLDGPLRVVVGYAPGGATDMVARFVGDRLAQKLGVPVLVDNKPGAGGRLAAQQVKAATAGQNVLMVANPAVMVVAPLVFKDNGYDPEKDFQPVAHVNDYDFGLARDIREVMQEPEVQRRFTDNKLVPVVATREQTEAMLKAYRAQWAPVVKTSGYNP